MSNIEIMPAQSNSDQLNATDLIGGPVTFTVIGYSRGPSEKQPLNLHIDGGYKPYRPNTGFRKVLKALWGEVLSNYVGRSFTLFMEPTVRFGKEEMGGIEISHMSHIRKDMTVIINRNRNQRRHVTIKSMPQYDAAQFAENLPKWNAAISSGRFSKDDVVYKAQQSGKLTDEQIQQIGA